MVLPLYAYAQKSMDPVAYTPKLPLQLPLPALNVPVPSLVPLCMATTKTFVIVLSEISDLVLPEGVVRFTETATFPEAVVLVTFAAGCTGLEQPAASVSTNTANKS